MRRILELFLLLIFAPFNLRTRIRRREFSCDRKLSAIARRLIHEAWLPVVTQYPGLRLPQHCPLHPWRDVHGRAELSKLHYRVNLWTCSACGKSFNKEDDLENHIANRHKDLFEPEDFSVCLADYCDILRCSTQRSVTRRPWTYRPQHDLQTFQVAKAPSKELVALLESSESFSSPATLRQTRSCRDGSCRDGSCQDGSCQGGSCKDGSCRGFHESGSTEIKSSKTVSRLSENSTECLSCSVAPPRCDRNKMREMKEKCVKLIDTCVNHMSLLLSDAKFEELRERMSSRVCWYLTCERYWDNQQRRRHSQPTGLFIVFIAAAVIYFTFSYYIVWGCF